MSIVLQNTLTNSTHKTQLHFSNTTQLNSCKTLKFTFINNPFQSLKFNKIPFHSNLYSFAIKAYDNSLTSVEQHEKTPLKVSPLDTFMSLMESFFVVSSMVVCVGCALNWVYFKQFNSVFVLLCDRVLVWLLVGAVAAGNVIRRRQWSRVCGPKTGFVSGNVIERVESLEESMRSVNTIVRVLSRRLEKLGIRFRVTRKAMKDPISETAALAQKNSEATRALAMQGDILEKELGEVQKVLLALQDMQQKQLELILAIAKSSKLLENKLAPHQGPGMNKQDSNKNPTQIDGRPIQARGGQDGATTNKVVG